MDVQVGVPPPPPPPPPPAFFAETTVPPPPPATQPVTTAPPTTTTVNVTSPPTQERIWLHPWTVNEMRDHASQWSLAGDAGVSKINLFVLIHSDPFLSLIRSCSI
jgi:hypothetical protein